MHVIGMKIEIRYFKKVTDTTFQHIFLLLFFQVEPLNVTISTMHVIWLDIQLFDCKQYNVEFVYMMISISFIGDD